VAPEAVHEPRRRDDEGEQQERAEVRPDAGPEQDAAGEDRDAGQRHEQLRRGRPGRASVGRHPLPLRQVPDPGAEEDADEGEPADQEKNVHDDCVSRL